MSRQLDVLAEERETKRRLAVIKALAFDLQGVVEFQGGQMVGFAINYNEYGCSMVWKAEFEGKRHVCFITTSSAMDCILTAVSLGKQNKLKWGIDKYAPAGS